MSESQTRPKPLVLIICDGWGVAPDSEGNALTRAATPNLDRYMHTYPSMTVISSGNEVGLSWGEMGNSEVGHLNIGAGRVYYQTFPRINKAMDDESFYDIPAIKKAVDHAKKNKSRLHILGVASEGNVHAAQDHLYTCLELAKRNGLSEVFLHVFMDGRDALYNSGKGFIEKLNAKIAEIGVGKIASMGGRHWGMDRDNRWERIETSFRSMTWDGSGEAPETAEDPLAAIEASYAKEVYDEEFPCVTIVSGGKPVGSIRDGDAVIFSNFRPDRARQLTKAFVLPDFSEFERPAYKDLVFVTFAEYEKGLPVSGVAFAPVVIENSLAEVISKAGMTQYHIAETEKYAHITFFLNGTIEEPFAGEDREIIPSPSVDSYDQAPGMSADKIAKKAVEAIESEKYDVMFVNFANGDMVGHTGSLEATKQAAGFVDVAIGQIVEATLARGGVALMTADHGNAENAVNLQTGDKDKEHSTNPVPFVIMGAQWEGQAGPAGDPPEGDLSLLPPVGILADVAPTILKILGLKQPPEMTGRPLI